MPNKETVTRDEGQVGGASARRLQVEGVNAHLRLIPREQNDFRVVVTFHHADGSLCEAELKPVEATDLMSEIALVIEQGIGRECRKEATSDVGVSNG